MENRQDKASKLLDTSGTALHALLTKLTLCEHTTSDLIQELFVRLCNSKGFEKAEDPLAYACRVAINLALDLRKKQRNKLLPLNEDCLPVRNTPSGLDNMIKAETLEEVLDATAQLNGLARDVVVMRYIEQESYETIAGRLGKKPQHIRSVCAKALARLRELLSPDERCSGGKELDYG